MQTTTLFLANDHAGTELKQRLIRHLSGSGLNIVDCGTNGTSSVDYPDFGSALARNIASHPGSFGILICGSGIGISIAANRNPQVRAALCTCQEMARLAREHNDANVLTLGARFTDEKTAIACTDIFLSTAFEGGRHEKRVKKLG